jgi:hypothetical protein
VEPKGSVSTATAAAATTATAIAIFATGQWNFPRATHVRWERAQIVTLVTIPTGKNRRGIKDLQEKKKNKDKLHLRSSLEVNAACFFLRAWPSFRHCLPSVYQPTKLQSIDLYSLLIFP